MRESKARELVATLGRYVKETRQLLGWSQQYVADQAMTSQGTISRLEAGRCTDVPLMSAIKVLIALAHSRQEITQGLPPPIAVILTCAAELAPERAAPPPDPNFRTLLHTYHRLPPIRQATFIRMMLNVASMLEDVAPIGASHERHDS